MLDTNALLNVAFALIANFTNAVEVPPDAVPQSPADIARFALSPTSPVIVFIQHHKGTKFSIFYGSVLIYSSPDSFFSSDYLLRVDERFVGEPKLTTNDVINLAMSTLQRLVKSGKPWTRQPDKVEYAGVQRGRPIPFYRLRWLDQWMQSALGIQRYTVTMEIDGRTGQIVDLSLGDTNFWDFALHEEMQRRFFTSEQAEKAPQAPDPTKFLPRPGTNQAAQIIEAWLRFCQWFGLDTGGQSNVAQLDWGDSFLYTNVLITRLFPTCRLRFTNNTRIQAAGTNIFGHYSADSFFEGDYMRKPKSAWDAIQGTVTIDWKQLATNLESLVAELVSKSGYSLPKSLMSPRNAAAKLGTEGLSRTVIQWRKWRPIKEPTPAEEFPLLFDAEFDLRTGEIKFLHFWDYELIQAIGRSLALDKPPAGN